MSSIAEAMGGSKSTLWSYFRSKEDLFTAVVETETAGIRTEITDVLATSRDLGTGLLRFCQIYLRAIESPEALTAIRIAAGESLLSPELGMIFYKQAQLPAEEALAHFLGRHTHALRDVAVEKMARTLTSLCTSRQLPLLLGYCEVPAVEAAPEFTDHFLRIYRV